MVGLNSTVSSVIEATGRDPFGSAYAAHGTLNFGIFGWQTVAGLLVIVADTAQAAVDSRNSVAVNQIDHVA